MYMLVCGEHFWKAGEACVREVKACSCVPLCIYVFSVYIYVYVGVWRGRCSKAGEACVREVRACLCFPLCI